MKQKLALKTDIYREAESAEEKATLLLEQVQGAKNPRLQQRLIGQLQSMLAESEPPPPPATGGEAAEEGEPLSDPTPRAVRVERVHLWGGLMRCAWALRLVEPARDAAAALLAAGANPMRTMRGGTHKGETALDIGKARYDVPGTSWRAHWANEMLEDAKERWRMAKGELRERAAYGFTAVLYVGGRIGQPVRSSHLI